MAPSGSDTDDSAFAIDSGSDESVWHDIDMGESGLLVVALVLRSCTCTHRGERDRRLRA
jgi:hypothetical protein